MKNEKIKKILAEVFRVILGVTFIFSGFVKSVDPTGFAFKIEDYLAAFNMSFFSFLSLIASFILCGMELVLGIMMLLGIYRKLSSRLILLIMCFMTPLTFYLAIANPVSDCGCFGDVLIISNWETFFKNVFLIGFSIYLFFYYKLITPLFKPRTQNIITGYIVIFTIVLLCHSYYYDSLVDFRPYRVGSYLPDKMTVDESDMPVEEVIFIYEKNGVKQEFSVDNYPWQDTTWKFVDRYAKMIKEGKEPEIKDFSIYKIIFNNNSTEIIDEVNITDDVLEDGNYTFLMIAPDLNKMNEREIIKFKNIYEYSQEYGYGFICLTSSTQEEIIEMKRIAFPGTIFASTDEKALKTIIRSLPGLVLLKDGTVVNKWSRPVIPGIQNLYGPLDKLEYSKVKDGNEKNMRNIIIIFLMLFVPVIIAGLIEVYIDKKRVNND